MTENNDSRFDADGIGETVEIPDGEHAMAREKLAQVLTQFRVGSKIELIADIDRHDPVEHADPLPMIPKGTRGEVVEVDEGSLLIRVPHPEDSSRPVVFRLHNVSSEHTDCPLSAIRPLGYSVEDILSEPQPPSHGISGAPDEHLDSAADPEKARRIDAVWPREELP